MSISDKFPVLPESEFKNHLCNIVECETRKMTSLFIERFKKATDQFIEDKRIKISYYLSENDTTKEEWVVKLKESFYIEYYEICNKIWKECNESIKPFSLDK